MTCKNYIKLEVNIVNAGTPKDIALICYNEDRTEIKTYVTGTEAEILTDVLLGFEHLSAKLYAANKDDHKEETEITIGGKKYDFPDL